MLSRKGSRAVAGVAPELTRQLGLRWPQHWPQHESSTAATERPFCLINRTLSSTQFVEESLDEFRYGLDRIIHLQEAGRPPGAPRFISGTCTYKVLGIDV